MDKTKTKLRQKISEGLTTWLRFEELCGRGGLFSESYLSLPIAQLLAANIQGEVKGEVNHPVLNSPPRPGRPAQLDFVVYNASKPILCVETKWADDSLVSVRDVVWDCVRLELAAHFYQCDAMFILAGKRARIEKMLLSKAFNPKTKTEKPSLVMGLNGGGRASVTIKAASGIVSKPLHAILQSYPNVNFATKYVCEQGSQIPKESMGDAYTSIVWNIRPEGVGKRHTFYGKDTV
jgi:hypothetical protein